jgi:uncharacterized protein YozE (UPF0346 family)
MNKVKTVGVYLEQGDEDTKINHAGTVFESPSFPKRASAEFHLTSAAYKSEFEKGTHGNVFFTYC